MTQETNLTLSTTPAENSSSSHGELEEDLRDWMGRPKTAIYELLLVGGSMQVWRHCEIEGRRIHPEELTSKNGKPAWLSDYGFGDYEDSRSRALKREIHRRVSALPEMGCDKVSIANNIEQKKLEEKTKGIQSLAKSLSESAQMRDNTLLSSVIVEDLKYWFWRALGRRWLRPVGRHEKSL